MFQTVYDLNHGDVVVFDYHKTITEDHSLFSPFKKSFKELIEQLHSQGVLLVIASYGHSQEIKFAMSGIFGDKAEKYFPHNHYFTAGLDAHSDDDPDITEEHRTLHDTGINCKGPWYQLILKKFNKTDQPERVFVLDDTKMHVDSAIVHAGYSALSHQEAASSECFVQLLSGTIGFKPPSSFLQEHGSQWALRLDVSLEAHELKSLQQKYALPQAHNVATPQPADPEPDFTLQSLGAPQLPQLFQRRRNRTQENPETSKLPRPPSFTLR